MANSSLVQTVTVAEGSVGPTQLAASAVTNAKIAAGALFTAGTEQASSINILYR